MHADVRTYLAALPLSTRRVLKQLRSEILAVAPDSVEAFSYRIPAFKLDGRVFVWYAGFKEHVSLYPIGDAIRTPNARALERFETSKGTVRFPLGAPLPLTLVRKLVRARVREVRGLALLLVTLVSLACARTGDETRPEYTGRVLASHALPTSRYGEGLATDGAALSMSDGSDSVRVLSPATFTAERVIHVRYEGAPVLKLNELEYVGGALLAYVHETDLVVWIDPTNGIAIAPERGP